VIFDVVLSVTTSAPYSQELVDLRQLLLEMGGLAEECLAASISALVDRDAGEVRRSAELETEINRFEKEIDERCIKILALHQPAASELRFVAMAMKIANDLERIGDLATNVAHRAESLMADVESVVPTEFVRMSRAVRAMITAALDAFVERSVDRARVVLQQDDEVDELHWQLYGRYEAMMRRDPNYVRRGIKMIHVIRDLERAADHATNIAEGVIYMVNGRDIRHPASSRVRK